MPLAPLNEPFLSDPTQLLALCIWREARGESIAAKTGVAHVILNRCAMSPAQGFEPTIEGNILKPWAFSSFMDGDPNSVKYPEPEDQYLLRELDPSWTDSLAVARTPGEDPTGGAVFYFSAPLTDPPAAWGSVEVSTVIGGLTFCRIA